MERVLSKLDEISSLWSTLGSPRDPDILNDKLQHVIFELDRLLEYEKLQRTFLAADIEDTMASIEESCNILGVSIENLMSSGLITGISPIEIMPLLYHQPTPSITVYNALSTLDSRLSDEISQRRSRIKLWLSTISQLCSELGNANRFKPYEEYHDDLCWATVQSISCALRDLSQTKSLRRMSFEVSARSIQFYWTVLGIQPNLDNELEHTLFKLFENFPIQPDIEDKPSKTQCKDFAYYEHVRAQRDFVVTEECIIALGKMRKDLETIYEERLALYKKYIKSISTIWNELNVPENRRCTIRRFLGKAYLEQLESEFDNVKTMMRALAEEYIDKFKGKLEGLWDRALLTQNERTEFIARLHEKADTMDEVHALVDEHMVYLQRLGPKAQIVDKLMRERKEHIQKMVDFEQSASDPERLFRSSFQLNEEERWRNTCFSTLVKYDDELYKAVREFEQVSGKPFMYKDDRYLDILNDEIANRDAFQTFFGFLNTEPKAKPKLQKTRSKPQPSPSNSKKLTQKTKGPSMTSSKSERRRSGKPGSKSPSETTAPPPGPAAETSQRSSKFPPTPPAETITKKDYISKNSRIPCPISRDSNRDMPRQPPGRRRWSGSHLMPETNNMPKAKQQRSSMSNLTVSSAPAVSTF